MNYNAVLESIEEQNQYDLMQVMYRCPKNGSLLNVKHDITQIKKTSANDWKNLFETRMGKFDGHFASGVWDKKEWVLPGIQDDHIVSLGEGRTPLLELKKLANELKISSLHLKQCGVSHTGSFKDLGMTVLVSHVKSLIAAGKHIRAVACASTGDTSAALSAYASFAGIPTVVFLPAGKITTAQLIQPISNGSLVLSLDTDFDGCMKIVQEITNDDASIYLANSMNPLRIEGQKTVGIEIIQQLGWQVPDWVIIPGGNLGNVSALVAGFEMLLETNIISKIPRICVAQAKNANPLYLSFQNDFARLEPVQAKKTLASAIQIGNPVSFPRAIKALKKCNGIVEQVTEEELANASARTDLHGMFTCPHTGVALGCLFKLVRSGQINHNERVVVVSTAHGLKFSEFKTGYHENRLDFRAKHINEPLHLPNDVNAVRKALKNRLGN